MNGQRDEIPQRFYGELSIQLRRAGFELQPVDQDGLLPVHWQDTPLCRVSPGGEVRYRQEDIADSGMDAALDRATDIAVITTEYMRQMENAPPLKVGNRIKCLAEFNGVVLAGQLTQFGAQFITWMRDTEMDCFRTGHYMEDYNAAKRDFAVRSGLVPREILFREEQLVDLHYCVQKALELDDSLTFDAEQRLIQLNDQIEGLCPATPEEAGHSYTQATEGTEENIVGKLTFADGSELCFADAEEYLKNLREELPMKNTTGLRYETLTDDPNVRKAVDDLVCDLYGEENPRALEDYHTRSSLTMEYGGGF